MRLIAARRAVTILPGVNRLLRFGRVRVESVDAPLSPDLIDRASRMLAEGGRLELVERLPLRPWSVDPWGRFTEELSAAEQRLERLLDRAPEGALADAVARDDDLPVADEPSLLVLEGGTLLGRVLRADAALRSGWAVLRWGDNPPDRLHLVLPDGARSAGLDCFAALLPDDASPTILLPPAAQEDPPFAALLAVGSVQLRAFSELPGVAAPSLLEALGEKPGLVVLAVDPRPWALLAAVGLLRSGATVVLVPQEGLPVDASWETSVALRVGGRLLLAAERRSPLGAVPLDVAVVPSSEGLLMDPVVPASGQLALPDAPGLWLASVEAPGRLRAGVVVLPVEGADIELVDGPGAEPGRRALLLRLDQTPLHRLASLVERAGCVGVLDAGAVLRDGAPDDLPPAARGVRVQRVMRRMLAAGYPVVGARWEGAWLPAPTGEGRLELLTGATQSTATSVSVEWDNHAARRRMIALLDGAKAAVELQTYQVEDDPVVREVELALARAAQRGVEVRQLADAVWSARGGVDALSPVLARLARCPGMVVRLGRPLPDRLTVSELKLRDHRKMLVVDGRTALLGGRNLGEAYLRGFDEVPLWPETPYSDIPWLDAGAEVEGPVVRTLRGAFEEAWQAASPVGPEPDPVAFEAPPAPVGDIDVRLVLHQGLQDANSLELTRDLIDGATNRLCVVNTFPLQFELVEALERALRRGVVVRALVGNVRPLHGERVPFPGGAVRDLANEVIHGRLDTLVKAGAAVHEYAAPLRPGWDPGLVRVLPHVHAKVLSADGQRFTVGSANLDITAAYWESEVLLLVEDEAATEALDRQIDALFASSPRLDADADGWQQRADRRQWISRNWPSALG